MIDENLIRATIDLTSYSSSPGWVGYFEANSRLCRDDSDVFRTYKELLSLGENEVVVFTSLHYDEDIKEAAEFSSLDFSCLERRVNFLRETGVLKMVDLSWKNEGYDSEEYDQYVNGLERDFRIIHSPDERFIEESVCAKINLLGLCGHFFLYHPDRYLFSYPHEDRGFGFIFAGSASSDQREKFLQLIGRLGDDYSWFLKKR